MNAKLFVSLILMAALSSAAACAIKAYEAACGKCGYDSYGKMDSQCFEGYQGSGVACLFAAYPLESIQYQAGGCKAVDTCRERLETCKAIATSGSDKGDCAFGNIDHCFANADRCVDIAIKNCDETPPGELSDIAPPAGWCDGLFFLFIPIFAGILIYGRR